MPHDADAYRRELDLIFQEMSDKESLAKKNALASKLLSHGVTAEILTEMRRILRRAGRERTRTGAELEAWIDGRLARLARMMDEQT